MVLTAPALAVKSKVDSDAQCRPKVLANGADLNLQQYQGKILYVDFWASWCGPCKLSFPFMNELKREFQGRAFEVVAISLDDEREKAMKFLRSQSPTFHLGIDQVGDCGRAFGVDGMPSSFVLGPQGEMLYAHKGFNESDKEEIRAVIRDALSKRGL